MATDPELKDGFPIPLWMKTKPTSGFEPYATSPPAPEDSFFFIKYPKADILNGSQKIDQDLQKLLQDQSKGPTAANSSQREKDWSKHTKPCQEVLHGIAPVNTTVNSVTSTPKSAGTDDGFKGEGAACGNSVVKVAHQMISSRPSQRGFAVASPVDDASDAHAQEQYHFARRGSKSLPVTPAHSPPGSPNSRRRKNGNRYFTSPFAPVEDASSRSWLTMALLGFKKDLANSTSTLAEEDALEIRLQGATLAESVENLGPSPKSRDPKLISEPSTQQPQLAKPAPAFRPKPSELREMNFWSPTSM